jgi:hypothetical protein
MQEFIAHNGGLMATVALTVMCLNILMTALKTVLEKIKDKTETQADNKMYDIVTKICNILSTVIDWTSANKEHNDDTEPTKPTA